MENKAKELKDKTRSKKTGGFSILELMVSMSILLVVLSLAMSLFSKSIGVKQRESSRTDALTAAQAALNVMSREISNAGFGLKNSAATDPSNGIVLADSNLQKIHFLSNVQNNNAATTDRDEDVTYFFEPVSQSILRYDANANGVNAPETSIVINRISSVAYQYFDYTGSSSTPTNSGTPTENTGRVRITITVLLENTQGQTNNQSVILTSDVTVRNANYMLNQY
ncbi:MAG: prepilin-type N-terminal cleavage/methylation domain-containing protein [Pyrinomonadaceae bacterium]